MSTTELPSDLAAWEPERQELPAEWTQLASKLINDLIGSLGHIYVLRVKFDALRVGNLLHQWGLSWPIVIAGYLWECDLETISHARLPESEQVLSHIKESIRYTRYIEEGNLLALLTPPYQDPGALLIAVAIYATALQTLLDQRNEQNSSINIRNLHGKLERVRDTLLSITKRLGMWYFKREIEDLCTDILDPDRFARDRIEHQSILQQEEQRLAVVCQQLTNYYTHFTGQSIIISYSTCGIAGMRRRHQDAHTTETTQKVHLTGFDLVTFDIIVPTVADCYPVLGIFNQLGYVQDRITDHIAHPKSNGYSYIALGLNLDLNNPFLQNLKEEATSAITCQLQIGTRTMQAIMRYGCLYPACYALFQANILQETDTPSNAQTRWHSEEGSVLYAIRNAILQEHQRLEPPTNNHISEQPTIEEQKRKPIIVYDQHRRPITLPRGATALDFAYAMNTLTGDLAVEAFINNRKAPLYRKLDMGDVIEIRLSRENPFYQRNESSIGQETYAVMNETKERIKELIQQYRISEPNYWHVYSTVEQYYHVLTQKEFSQKEFDKELEKFVIENKELQDFIQEQKLSLIPGSTFDYLKHLDSRENVPFFTPHWAAQQIMQQITDYLDETEVEYRWLTIENVNSHKHFFPQQHCKKCTPTHPQKVIGLLHAEDKNLIIHRIDCPHLAFSNSQKVARISVDWQYLRMFRMAFSIEAQDRRGLTHDITRQLRHHQCDLLSIHGDVLGNDKQARFSLLIRAYDEQEVIYIWEALSQVETVRKVEIARVFTPRRIYERLHTLQQPQSPVEGRTQPSVVPLVTKMTPRNLILKNEFDISRPPQAKMFYGREDQVELMQQELCGREPGRAVLMYGPRRSGKSSLCKNFLERYVQLPLVSVYHSLQGATHHDEATILMHLADEIRYALRRQLHLFHLHNWHHYDDTDPQVRFKQILHDYLEPVPDTKLILVLDEFGGPLEAFEKHHTLEERFFNYWRELISEVSQLSIVLILPTSSYNTLTTKVPGNAFSFARQIQLPFLSSENTQRLLLNPLQEQHIMVNPSVATQIFNITAGNPYFIQLLGMHIIELLNQDKEKRDVHPKDLQIVINRLIWNNTHNHFDFYRDEVQNIQEMRILKQIVELTNYRQNHAATVSPPISLRDLSSRMKQPMRELRPALERMRAGLLLKEYETSPTNPHYTFQVELARLWMTHHGDFFSAYYQSQQE